MPPSIVLEVLRILKGEIDLRELTRTTEQRREVVEPEFWRREAGRLKTTQDDLLARTKKVIETLEAQVREEGKKYGKDIKRLEKAEVAMADAARLLGEPATGSATIAAETEAIEALLETKRASGGGGGGGGSSPGGNTGGGDTDRAAIALIGVGKGQKAASRLVKQSTGHAGDGLPEEYRRGLDAYFSALEGGGR